jgi:hypothetical protein
VTTANPPEDPDTAKIEDVRLGSRLYLAIRLVSQFGHFLWTSLLTLITDPLGLRQQKQVDSLRNAPYGKYGNESNISTIAGQGLEVSAQVSAIIVILL